MVDTPRFYPSDVISEMVRMLTPTRSEMVERPLDPEELAAVQRADIERLVSQARAQQRLRDIQTRRPGFQALMGYGAQQANPISQARASEAAMGEAGRRLEHPIYQRFVEDQINRAANVQEPAAIDIARLIMDNRAPTQAAPASALSVVAPPAAAPAQTPTQAAPPSLSNMYKEFNQAAPVYRKPAIPPAVQRAVQVARQSAGVPAPPRRPDSVAPQPPPRELMEAARMDAVRREWEEFNRSESPAAFVRASKLMQSVMPQAEARGGGVSSKGASKPDAVHKALEIIHHLLIHGR
jgi:hypothetical protein